MAETIKTGLFPLLGHFPRGLLENLRGGSDHIPDRRELLLNREMSEETSHTAEGDGIIVHRTKAKKGKGGSVE